MLSYFSKLFRIVFAFAFALSAIGTAWSDVVSTTAPPQIVFVPVPRAYSSIKHPTLPVLYVTIEGSPESKNLFTFRLNADGTIDPNSKRVCSDYFSVDGKTNSFPHRLLRPAINAENHVIYLAAYPITLNSAQTFSISNNFEYATVALDEQGQPTTRLNLYRTDNSGQQGLTGIRYEPTLRKLFYNYYSSTQWSDLDKDSLPVSINPTKTLNAGVNFWVWIYVPEWRRFYQTRAASHMGIVPVSTDNLQVEFIQWTSPQLGPQMPAQVEVSTRFRKIYVLDSVPQREMIVYPLTTEGRLTSVPRYFPLGPTAYVRCDFKAGLLYAFNKSEIRVFNLDTQGFPTGSPRVTILDFGDPWDIYLEKDTGKLYVCTATGMP